MNIKILVALLIVGLAESTFAQAITIPVQITKTTFEQDGMMLRWKNFNSKQVGAKLSHRFLGSYMYENERADFLFSVLSDTTHGPYTDEVDAELNSKEVQVSICSSDHCDYGKPCNPRCHYSWGIKEELRVQFRGQTFNSTEEGIP